MELTYRMEGNYLLPNLSAPEEPRVGKYGVLRLSYLRKHRNGIYTGLFISGKLNGHLEEVDRQANEMVEQLIEQMAEAEGVTFPIYQTPRSRKKQNNPQPISI